MPMIVSGINKQGIVVHQIVCRYEATTINSAIAEMRLNPNVIRVVIDIAV